MKYAVEVQRSARKQLQRLPAVAQEQVLDALAALGDMPRPPGCSKLTGRDAWRVRVGDYRIIYEILDDKRIVVVVVVAHRKEAYR